MKIGQSIDKKKNQWIGFSLYSALHLIKRTDK